MSFESAVVKTEPSCEAEGWQDAEGTRERFTDDVCVKVEQFADLPDCDSCNEDAETEGGPDDQSEPYSDHEIKDEIELGPEIVQERTISSHLPTIIEEDLLIPRVTINNKKEIVKKEKKGSLLQDATKTKIYVCDSCGKVFIRKYKLIEHIYIHLRRISKRFPRKLRGRRKPPACEICGKEFSNRDNLKRHKRIHTREKIYTCEHCNKEFFSIGNLNRHKTTHTKTKPYACNICEKSYRHAESLKRHARIHDGLKPFLCITCGRRFSQVACLKSHQRSHTGVKPYACDICKKQFTIKPTLKEHMRVHTKEKPYECEICKKAFSYRTSFRNHKTSHMEVKPYSCDTCKIQFSQLSNLKRHLLSSAHPCLVQNTPGITATSVI